MDLATVYLERAKDPVLAALDTAAADDEPYTDEDSAADAKALAVFGRDEFTPIDELITELGSPNSAAGGVRLVGLDEWRLRVGDWRVRYPVDAPARRIVVLSVDPRTGGYKRP